MVRSPFSKGAIGLLVALALADAPSAQAQELSAALTELTAMWQSAVSALSVTTKQVSTSGNQVAVASLKAAEANANALTSVASRLGIADATSKFAAGRDQTAVACSVVELRQMASAAAARNAEVLSLVTDADQDFIDSSSSAEDVQRDLSERRASYYCSDEEYAAGLCSSLAGVGYNTSSSAGDTDASVFMSGSASGSEEVATGLDFLDRLAPLPTVPEKTSAARAIERIINLRGAAQKTMAREVISGSIVEGLE